MEIIAFKLFIVLLVILSIGVASARSALASGTSPPVNVDMGCSFVGQAFVYDGTSASCGTLPYSGLSGTPTIPATPFAYENTTQRLNPIIINKTATVAGGVGNAVSNLTNDGTSTGTALCPNGVMLSSPNLSVNDATAPYQFSWAWSNSNKTFTVLAQKASGLAVLTFTLLGLPAPVPNGAVINETIVCY